MDAWRVPDKSFSEPVVMLDDSCRCLMLMSEGPDSRCDAGRVDAVGSSIASLYTWQEGYCFGYPARDPAQSSYHSGQDAIST